jgi:Putative transmembrane protein (PGPGW)
MGQHQNEPKPADASESDAEATVAEVELQPGLARAWHDHPAIVPFKAVLIFIGRNGRRVAVTAAGVLLLVLGVAGLALPILPGWLLIFAGFAVLSTEYVWAERMLKRAKKAAAAAKDKALRRSGTGAPDTSVPRTDVSEE